MNFPVDHVNKQLTCCRGAALDDWQGLPVTNNDDDDSMANLSKQTDTPRKGITSSQPSATMLLPNRSIEIHTRRRSRSPGDELKSDFTSIKVEASFRLASVIMVMTTMMMTVITRGGIPMASNVSGQQAAAISLGNVALWRLLHTTGRCRCRRLLHLWEGDETIGINCLDIWDDDNEIGCILHCILKCGSFARRAFLDVLCSYLTKHWPYASAQKNSQTHSRMLDTEKQIAS